MVTALLEYPLGRAVPMAWIIITSAVTILLIDNFNSTIFSFLQGPILLQTSYMHKSHAFHSCRWLWKLSQQPLTVLTSDYSSSISMLLRRITDSVCDICWVTFSITINGSTKPAVFSDCARQKLIQTHAYSNARFTIRHIYPISSDDNRSRVSRWSTD